MSTYWDDFNLREYHRLQTEMQTQDILAQIDALLWRRPYSAVDTRKPGWSPDFPSVATMPRWLAWFGLRQRKERR